jgi:hypothetical protein
MSTPSVCSAVHSRGCLVDVGVLALMGKRQTVYVGYDVRGRTHRPKIQVWADYTLRRPAPQVLFRPH